MKEFIKTRCEICVIDCDFGFVQENAECGIDIEQRVDGDFFGFRIYCKTGELPPLPFYACINGRILECYAAGNVIMPLYTMREKNVKALFGIQK